jgi:putative transposase
MLCARRKRGRRRWRSAARVGVSEQTFYRWKRQFAGMGVVELRRLRQVEEENRKLKQLVADLSLDKHMLQEALRKNW